MQKNLRIVFMGTPVFAATALQAIINAGFVVVAAYSQPPKPAGRGHKETKSAVHLLADTVGIPVFTPKTLRTEQAQAEFKALQADIAVVAAYGLILPQAILDAPRFGCLNIHGSLLPRWRGAAPLQRAILAGDKETGITIMQMDAGLDTGAMIKKENISIHNHTTTMTLHDDMAALGARMIVDILSDYENGIMPVAVPQPHDGVTYADKLTKNEGLVTWHEPADLIHRKMRALAPWPGCYFSYQNENIKILDAECVDNAGPAGVVLHNDAIIACGKNALTLLRVQRPNKAPVTGREFLSSLNLRAGDRLA